MNRGVNMHYNLEILPIQIKTNSESGSDKSVVVSFSNMKSESAGGIKLFFTTPPQYKFTDCTNSRTDFFTNLPTETDKIWTITLHRDSDKRRVVVHCNEKEILNVVLSDTSCDVNGWRNKWSREVEKIKFLGSGADTASDFYRAGTYCIIMY